ncbi:MAG: hypothetical protein Q4A52_00655, partial [Bacillota bacterium]|nr:hypothetical protein [Bacillota bacterium]
TIEVTFNTAIAGVDESGITGVNADKIASVEVVGKKVVIKLKDAMDGADEIAATQQIGFKKDAVVSVLGGKNAVEASAQVDDKIQPEIEKVEVGPAKTIKLTFTKKLNGTVAEYKNDLVIVDAKGNTLLPSALTTTGLDKVVTVALNPLPTEVGQYVVSSQSAPFNIKSGTNLLKPFSGKTVMFNDFTGPTFDAAPKGTDNSATKLVLTASDKLFTAADGATAAGATIPKAKFTPAGTATINANPAHADKVITITFNPNAADDDTLTIAANSFYDEAGNGNLQVVYKFNATTGWVKQ